MLWHCDAPSYAVHGVAPSGQALCVSAQGSMHTMSKLTQEQSWIFCHTCRVHREKAWASGSGLLLQCVSALAWLIVRLMQPPDVRQICIWILLAAT